MGRRPGKTVREYRGNQSSITFWLDPALKERLINRANAEHRSMTGHILHLVEKDLESPTPTTQEQAQS